MLINLLIKIQKSQYINNLDLSIFILIKKKQNPIYNIYTVVIC